MNRNQLLRNRIERASQLLERLGSVDNVPFHEHAVLDILEQELRSLGLEASYDRWGNLIARYRCGTGAQPLALVAHTDHPAFEIVELMPHQGSRYPARASMLGRVWAENFAHPVPVRVQHAGAIVRGTIVRAVDTGPTIDLFLEVDGPVAVGDTGVWDLPGFVRDGPFVRMRSVDDLGGCAVIVQVLRELVETNADGDVTALFTRAEEVGLVGAMMAAADGVLSPETIVISLETSKALPGAEQGRGPVIRVGDYRRSFHPDGEALLLAARAQLGRFDPPVPVQRQLMSGGTCEATAFAVYGYRVTGVALPLDNYHNAAGDDSIAMESIHLGDLSGAVDLLVEAVRAAAASDRPGPADERSRYEPLVQQFAERLAATAPPGTSVGEH